MLVFTQREFFFNLLILIYVYCALSYLGRVRLTHLLLHVCKLFMHYFDMLSNSFGLGFSQPQQQPQRVQAFSVGQTRLHLT